MNACMDKEEGLRKDESQRSVGGGFEVDTL